MKLYSYHVAKGKSIMWAEVNVWAAGEADRFGRGKLLFVWPNSNISCSLLAILCFDRQGQGHEPVHCNHISCMGDFWYKKSAHGAMELHIRNHPCAISHTWKRTCIAALERLFRPQYCMQYRAHGKRAIDYCTKVYNTIPILQPLNLSWFLAIGLYYEYLFSL